MQREMSPMEQINRGIVEALEMSQEGSRLSPKREEEWHIGGYLGEDHSLNRTRGVVSNDNKNPSQSGSISPVSVLNQALGVQGGEVGTHLIPINPIVTGQSSSIAKNVRTQALNSHFREAGNSLLEVADNYILQSPLAIPSGTLTDSRANHMIRDSQRVIQGSNQLNSLGSAILSKREHHEIGTRLGEASAHPWPPRCGGSGGMAAA